MGKYKFQKRFTEEEIKDIANKLGVVPETVQKRQFRAGFFQWVEDALWLASVGQPIKCRIYRNGNEKCAVPVLQEVLGVSRSSAEKRLKLWEEGLFDIDDMMRPGEIPKPKESPEWEGLTSTDRSYNLNNLSSFIEYTY